jgi:uncharacterized membrane protein
MRDMNVVSVLLALHLLGVVVWVGGMAFALLVLRPALAVLEPPQRLALHSEVFRRFFRIVWHTMPLVLLTGYAMLFGVPTFSTGLGGFAGANPAVHIMHLLGLVMTAIFLFIVFVPWKAFREATVPQAKAAAADRIRGLIRINLVLGVVTVVVAAWAT